MTITFHNADERNRREIEYLLLSNNLSVDDLFHAGTKYFLVRESNNVIGTAAFEYYNNDVLLRSVAISKDFQRLGIGSQFLDWIIAHARDSKAQSIILLTEAANHFFSKKGFKEIRRSSLVNKELLNSSQFQGSCCSSAICMKMDLD